MSEFPWDKKNNTFTWLSSLYNAFKGYLCYKMIISQNLLFDVQVKNFFIL